MEQHHLEQVEVNLISCHILKMKKEKLLQLIHGIVGGVGIPDDLIVPFVERLIELDKCEMKIGEETIKDICPTDINKKIFNLREREDEER